MVVTSPLPLPLDEFDGRTGLEDSRPAARWFDGHLDLACIALEGRDLRAPLSGAAGPPQPPSITLPSLREGRVSHVLATLFTGLGSEGPCGYVSSDDPEPACRAGLAQLGVYDSLEAAGELRLVRQKRKLDCDDDHALAAVILMEGADPIRTPAEAPSWFERGVRVVGLTWARGTRYAAGNAAPGPLTPLGRTLIAALDEIGIIHDCSHLADEAAGQLLQLARGPVCASHSNCRSLAIGHSERNLPDDLIRAIAERDGVIGLNLFSLFLTPEGDRRRATIDEAIAHVEHIVEVTGRVEAVALGSDMDGGFGADRLPEGIDCPAELPRLTDALRRRGWSEDQVAGFRFNNWARFLERSLPS